MKDAGRDTGRDTGRVTEMNRVREAFFVGGEVLEINLEINLQSV